MWCWDFPGGRGGGDWKGVVDMLTVVVQYDLRDSLKSVRGEYVQRGRIPCRDGGKVAVIFDDNTLRSSLAFVLKLPALRVADTKKSTRTPALSGTLASLASYSGPLGSYTSIDFGKSDVFSA